MNVGRFSSLPIVGLSPAKKAMVEGTKGESKEEKGDEVQGEFCCAREG